MRDLAILFIHLLATIAKQMRPGGARAVVAESLLVKHQLVILNRGRERAPNLRPMDRVIAGLCIFFMRPGRLIRSAIVLKPSTFLAFHGALVKRKYRLLFTPKNRGKPGPKGPSPELIAAIVEMKGVVAYLPAVRSPGPYWLVWGMGKSDYIFRYRVRNWPEYNRALVRRGSLTLWIDEQAIESWRDVGSGGRGGRPRIYADTAIECALVVKSAFHLSLRATQGFLESVMKLMAVELPVPDYSTVSRRQSGMTVSLGVDPGTRPRHVVIDSTGLKVYGAGAWHIRKHGSGRRRVWRKLHMGVDESTKEIVAVELTRSRIHDCHQLPEVLAKIPGQIGQVSADRAYDTKRCYEAILDRGAAVTIPPRKTARTSHGSDPPPWRIVRDTVLRQIKKDGRYVWRQSSGATRQSLAENAVSRFKAMLGPKLAARGFENQKVEAAIKCQVLNRMSALGLPRSERILQS